MPPANGPKFSLADVMILVATTGLSLSCYVLLDNGLFSGQRYFFGIFQQPLGGLDTLQLISRVDGALSMLLILFGGWTLVLPVLPIRKHRSPWRQAEPSAGNLGLHCRGDRDVGLGRSRLRHVIAPRLGRRPPGIASSLLDTVSGIRWPDPLRGHLGGRGLGRLIVTRGWRPSANGFDRLGRCVGILWFVAGATFAAAFAPALIMSSLHIHGRRFTQAACRRFQMRVWRLLPRPSIRYTDGLYLGFDDEVHRRLGRTPEVIEAGFLEDLAKFRLAGLRAEGKAHILR